MSDKEVPCCAVCGTTKNISELSLYLNAWNVTCKAHEKYISYEVKILRDGDPGGALTKAIGQTALYARLGYRASFGLIFDQRTSVSRNSIVSWRSEILEQDSSHVHYFY